MPVPTTSRCTARTVQPTVQPAALQLKVLEADERPVCVSRSTSAPFTGSAPLGRGAPTASGGCRHAAVDQRAPPRATPRCRPPAHDVRAAADRLVAAATGRPVAWHLAGRRAGRRLRPRSRTPTTPGIRPAGPATRMRRTPSWRRSTTRSSTRSVTHLDHVVILGGDELIPMARSGRRDRRSPTSTTTVTSSTVT